ncbi:MAG TPA: glucosyltransferase domain-containing protein [Thermoanaerobaculia bacterium]|nr:glucosyltransferase domain-containing protein [Thermoanaerobaculia bacterium]
MPISDASRRRGATLAITAALAAFAGAALYLPGLDTGFASEDFLVLAHLSRESLLDTLRHELSSPWLGLAPVGFWRPVSTVMLALELRLFGLHPARFHAAHLAVHAFNAWLVAIIVVLVVGRRRRADDLRDRTLAAGAGGAGWIAAASAALFAIHPFHPSAVLFIGAFATLFAAAFSLLAIYCYLAARERGASSELSRRGISRRRLDLAAVLFFVLAVGSYEAAIVAPIVLLVTTILLPGPGPISPRGDTRARAGFLSGARPLAPFFAVVAIYLLIRWLVLGTSVGGYTAFRDRFWSAPLERARDLVAALGRILHPHYGTEAAPFWIWGIWAIAGVAALVVARDRRRAGRAALAGLAWIAFFLAPFTFVGLVPANGRYAYLAIAGVVVVIGGLGARVAARSSRLGVIAIAAASIAVAADWIGALRHTVEAYDRARALVAAVRSDVLGVAAEHADTDTVVLVESPPDFIEGAAHEPIAKVFQYGLAESVRPPFGPLARAPVPLPESLSASSRAALAALPRTVRYRWDSHVERLMPVAADAAPLATLEIGPFDPVAGRLTASCEGCGSTRLVVLTSALPFVLPALETTAGRVTFAVSNDFLRGLDDLGPGPAFFWVEESGEGATTAISPIARFDLGTGAAESFAEAAANIPPRFRGRR